MASTTQVKTYLAYWFQLGKKLILRDGSETLLPKSIIKGDRFSPEFEACWQKVIDVDGKNCYLEGSNQSIENLLSPSWDIHGCARCDMPVAIVESGIQSLDCLCSNLDNWPNDSLPKPRLPISDRSQLDRIKERLKTK